MKFYKEFNLINSNENYLVFKGSCVLEMNIIDDSFSISYESFNVFERSSLENEIIKSSKSVSIDIKKNCDLKIIYFDDCEEVCSYNFNINENINVNLINVISDFCVKSKHLIEYNIKENAVLNICDFESITCELIEFYNYYVHKNALLNLNNLRINDNCVSSIFNVYLLDKRANCVLNNSVINSSSLNQKYNFTIHHLKDYTKSELIAYAVSKNKSELNIDSNGIIKKNAKKAEMFQKTKGIILDLESVVSASPLLEIDEFDCMATHGASIGAIDESDLFYLMSRGLSREMSQNLIINGFFNPYLSKLNDESVFAYIQSVIKDHIA